MKRPAILAMVLIVVQACGSTTISGSPSASSASTVTSGAPPSAAATPVASESRTSSASVSAGPHRRYVAVGDSGGYGAADCGGCVPYPVGLAARIAADTGMPIELHNLTQHNTLTSSMLLAELMANDIVGTDPGIPRDPGEMGSGAATPMRIQDAIASADIITIQVGGNDIFRALFDVTSPSEYGCGGNFDAACVKATIDPIGANLEKILTEIDALRAGKPTIVRIVGDDDNWTDDAGVAPALNAARAAGTLALIVAEYVADQSVAAKHHAQVVDMFHIFNGPAGTLPEDRSYFDPQGGHPNQKGQDAYVAEIAKLGYVPLR